MPNIAAKITKKGDRKKMRTIKLTKGPDLLYIEVPENVETCTLCGDYTDRGQINEGLCPGCEAEYLKYVKGVKGL